MTPDLLRAQLAYDSQTPPEPDLRTDKLRELSLLVDGVISDRLPAIFEAAQECRYLEIPECYVRAELSRIVTYLELDE